MYRILDTKLKKNVLKEFAMVRVCIKCDEIYGCIDEDMPDKNCNDCIAYQDCLVRRIKSLKATHGLCLTCFTLIRKNRKINVL
ncbi:hypothetical protein MCHI_001574 [Candidatus Magnetoovum chiemensis]|nr:hypothetical protein MCHI_001574 [Candidatus Magnetoovum chiemensis]